MLPSCSSTRMVLTLLLVSGLLGWVECQEGQSMTPEEKTVIRYRKNTPTLIISLRESSTHSSLWNNEFLCTGSRYLKCLTTPTEATW